MKCFHSKFMILPKRHSLALSLYFVSYCGVLLFVGVEWVNYLFGSFDSLRIPWIFLLGGMRATYPAIPTLDDSTGTGIDCKPRFIFHTTCITIVIINTSYCIISVIIHVIWLHRYIGKCISIHIIFDDLGPRLVLLFRDTTVWYE